MNAYEIGKSQALEQTGTANMQTRTNRRRRMRAALTLPGLAVLAYLSVQVSSAITAAESVPPNIYRSDFGRDPGGFRQIHHYYGSATLSLDPNKRGPSGEPSLRIDCPEKTKTIIGIVLDAKPGRRFRLQLAGCVDLKQGDRISVCAKCVETGGTRDTWVGLGTFPQGPGFRDFTSQPFEVAPFASRVQVFLFATDVSTRSEVFEQNRRT